MSSEEEQKETAEDKKEPNFEIKVDQNDSNRRATVKFDENLGDFVE